MKRLIAVLVAAAFLVGLGTAAEAGYYWFQVKDEQGRALTSGFVVQVYTAATQAHDVVFTDTGYKTQKTNPLNPNSQGVVAFATTNSTVDLSVWGYSGIAKGAVAKVSGLSDTDHVIVVDTQSPLKHLRTFWDAAISKGGQTDTGIDLPVGALVSDVWIEVATAQAAASISVGLLSTEASGDTDGFCKSQGTDFAAAPGQWFRCEASRSRSTAREGAGGSEKFYYTSNTRGALLASFTMGQNTLTDLGGTLNLASTGQYIEYPHHVMEGAAKSIVYQTRDIGGVGVTDANKAKGYLHLFWLELRRR